MSESREEGLTQRHRGSEGRKSQDEITEIIIGVGIEIHRNLGPGLLESVYETIMASELVERGLIVERQVELPVHWKGKILDQTFRLDLLVDGQVIVELKSVEKTQPVFKKQLLTYLRLTGLHLGLLINFGLELFKDGIERVVHGTPPDSIS
jgi:iron complex transport system substrate-binding protein